MGAVDEFVSQVTGQDNSQVDTSNPFSAAWDLASSPFRSTDNFRNYLESPGNLAGMGGPLSLVGWGMKAWDALKPRGPGDPIGPRSAQPDLGAATRAQIKEQLAGERRIYQSGEGGTGRVLSGQSGLWGPPSTATAILLGD